METEERDAEKTTKGFGGVTGGWERGPNEGAWSAGSESVFVPTGWLVKDSSEFRADENVCGGESRASADSSPAVAR